MARERTAQSRILDRTRLTKSDEQRFLRVLRMTRFNPDFKRLKRKDYVSLEDACYEVVKGKVVWYADFVRPLGIYVRNLYERDEKRPVIKVWQRSGEQAAYNWTAKGELLNYNLNNQMERINQLLADVRARTYGKQLVKITKEDARWISDKELLFKVQKILKDGKSVDEAAEIIAEQKAREKTEEDFNMALERNTRRPLEYLMRRVEKFSVTTPAFFLFRKYAKGKFDLFETDRARLRIFDGTNTEFQQLYRETVFGKGVKIDDWFAKYHPLEGVFEQSPIAYTSKAAAEEFMGRIFSFSENAGRRIILRLDYATNLKPEIKKGYVRDIETKLVGELNFSCRVRRCLQRLNVATVKQLIDLTSGEMLSVRNFGPTSLMEVQRKLSEFDLKLKG